MPETRIRAWFLISVVPDRITELRNALLALDELHGDKIVVVRMDEVAGGEFNLVAPVDIHEAVTPDPPEIYLNLLIDELNLQKRKEVVRDYKQLRVISRYPEIPHTAAGYITEQEFIDDPEHDKDVDEKGNPVLKVTVNIGLQKHSPGFTPWG